MSEKVPSVLAEIFIRKNVDLSARDIDTIALSLAMEITKSIKDSLTQAMKEKKEAGL